MISHTNVLNQVCENLSQQECGFDMYPYFMLASLQSQPAFPAQNNIPPAQAYSLSPPRTQNKQHTFRKRMRERVSPDVYKP